MATAKLIVSLHDVTPAHRDRLERAERFLAAWGISQATYLLVPDFHGIAVADGSEHFVDWCRASRPFAVQWFLHGYFHSERVDPPPRARLDLIGRVVARLLSDHEAEFGALRGVQLLERLHAGIRVFEGCLGTRPTGFVAPAWLADDELIPALTTLGFSFTENHRRVFQLQTGWSRAVPVITWATRTVVRRYGSLAVSALQRRIWARQPVVRIALHPHDFDHAVTVASIARTVEAFQRHRELSGYDDDLFEER